MKLSVDEFIEKHGLRSDGINVDAVLRDFEDQMKKGLAGGGSSLAMIPTFISVDSAVPEGKPVIVIDAGGTHLRVATVVFDKDGQARTRDFSRYEMPGIESEIGPDDFFRQFAGYLNPVIDKSDRIGFCFSFPAEITPDRDGRLLRWTKEVKAPGVVGKYIGRELLAALGEKGRGRQVTVLNDTTATLLAGKAMGGGKHSSYIGFILGTGTNIAYVERNSNITKRSDLDLSGRQAINVESGNFNLAPRGDLDVMIDSATVNPGGQQFEKMISGRYFGDLSLLVLKAAAGEGLFAETTSERITDIRELTGIDVDLFLQETGKGVLCAAGLDGDDRARAEELLYAVIDRSAKLTALNLSAAALKSGAGRDGAGPVCMNIDGSSYYKTTGYRQRAESYLREILGSRGVAYEIVHAEDAPVIGAAIAGLSNLSS